MQKRRVTVTILSVFVLFTLFLTNTPAWAGSSGIHVESATYGSNCGVASGNVTNHIARQCNGKARCRYTVDHKIIGDPARGCAKTYTVRYRCGNNPQVFEKSLPAEAGWGDKAVVLDCRGSRRSTTPADGMGLEAAINA